MNKTTLIGIAVALLVFIAAVIWRSGGLERNLEPVESGISTPQITNSQTLDSDGSYQVQESHVNYFEETEGFLAKPEGEGDFPGVVVIHEWWGLNDNIKNMARQLASEGYMVLAVDLYGGEIAEDSARARELTSSLDQEKATENLQAAADYIREQGTERVASLGWCFGGGQSLQLSLSGEALDATVIYYGKLVTDEDQLEAINWPVLGIFGEEDQSIPVSTVNEFDSILDELDIENEIHIYPRVGHAFANPSGDNFAPEATKDAWEKTIVFLNKHLKS